MKKVPRYWNSSSLDKQATFFPVENRALRFGDADPHASGFTRGCKPPQYTLQVLAWNGQQDIICKELGWIPVIPKVSVVGLGGCVGSIPARVIPKTRKMVFPCLALSIWTCTLVVTHTTRTIRAGVLVKTCSVCNAPIFSDKSKLYTQHPTKHGGQCAQCFPVGLYITVSVCFHLSGRAVQLHWGPHHSLPPKSFQCLSLISLLWKILWFSSLP